jgi:hypothetical protein
MAATRLPKLYPARARHFIEKLETILVNARLTITALPTDTPSGS